MPNKTDTIIHNSCYPREHKIAIFRSWIHRVNKLPLGNAKELNVFTVAEKIVIRKH
jgi:hypothetical protein